MSSCGWTVDTCEEIRQRLGTHLLEICYSAVPVAPLHYVELLQRQSECIQI